MNLHQEELVREGRRRPNSEGTEHQVEPVLPFMSIAFGIVVASINTQNAGWAGSGSGSMISFKWILFGKGGANHFFNQSTAVQRFTTHVRVGMGIKILPKLEVERVV
mmetsp:Transcript_13991/g.37229  ORF Transcript_13991/g.37229 Transcript_13991/m.37229 type:complete len:107 (-) Transcript_13991:27-347(-)